jgi:hypothetical protein
MKSSSSDPDMGDIDCSLSELDLGSGGKQGSTRRAKQHQSDLVIA